MKKAFAEVIGTREDPHCGCQLHECLSQGGLTIEPWMTPGIKNKVRLAIGGEAGGSVLCKAVDESPSTPVHNLQDGGTYLTVLSLS